MKKLSIVMLVSLISGCSCNRSKNSATEEPETKKPEIVIVDPTATSELSATGHPAQSVSENTVTSNSAPVNVPVNQNKTKKQPGPVETETFSHQTYPASSYTDLDFVTYDTGLKYQILHEGPAGGQTPRRGQTVVTHYTSWHDQNGKPGRFIDSTYERNQPFEFKIGHSNVIRGWDDALMDMRVGDQRRLYIPSEMAFGQAGATELVPGDTDLIYEVEILDIRD